MISKSWRPVAILACFQQQDRWFTGVVVTDGRGSPRTDVYEQYATTRCAWCASMSSAVRPQWADTPPPCCSITPAGPSRTASDRRPIEDLVKLLQTCRPQEVYTHNLADKHDTHVAVTLRTIAAIRSLSKRAATGAALRL